MTKTNILTDLLMRRITRYLFVASSVILLLVGCRAEDRVWEQAVASGVLRVGMDASYPPFEYMDDNEQFAGFDVDFARELGSRLGLEVVFVNIAYDGLYDALQTGRVDMLVSGLVPLHMFEAKADFSEPYFNASEYLVVPLGSPVASMEGMAGRTLAVEYGSGGDVEGRQWQRRVDDLEIIRFPDPDSALQAVLAGAADAALVDAVTARLGVGQHLELALGSPVNEAYFVVAVPDGSLQMLRQVNVVIAEAIEDGTTDRLIDRWFGPQRYIVDAP